NWYVPMIACILVIQSEDDIVFLMKVIAVGTIIDSLLGVIEFVVQRRYYFDLMPKSMLDSMLANNPTLAAMYYVPTFRNGLYRSASIFSVPLSFGEFAAIAGPIAAHFVFYARDKRDQALGIVAGIFCLLALFCAGARGGYLGFLIAMPI